MTEKKILELLGFGFIIAETCTDVWKQNLFNDFLNDGIASSRNRIPEQKFGIKVNTLHPGYVQTEMNKSGDQQNGELSVPEGARTSVRLALIGNDGPTGGFYYFDQVLPW